MSSPSRPLSPKRDSLLNSRSTSPLKSKPSTPANSHVQAMKKLPKLGVDLTPAKTQASLGFQIYEDKPDEYELYHKSRADSDDICLHDDKENILQPKVLSLDQNIYAHRNPLANLDIHKFGGSAIIRGHVSRRPIALEQLYQPMNYENEFRSTHKFGGLPSFVTPPRNAMRQILHRAKNSIAEEVDEMELRLIAKSHEVARRKRAMSVGVNKGKKHLVQKPRFQVFTN